MDRVPSLDEKGVRVLKVLQTFGRIEPGDKIAIYNDCHVDLFSGRKHGLSHKSEIEIARSPKNAKSLENLTTFCRELELVIDEDPLLKDDLEPHLSKALDGLNTLLITYESLPKEKSKTHFIKDCIQTTKDLRK